MIITLVYDGGTILASKRVPYDDLVNDNFDESLVSERLSRQHKLICAAVRAGRLEDLKKMSRKVPATVGTYVEPSVPVRDTAQAFIPVTVPVAVAETPIAVPDAVRLPLTVGNIETQRIISVTSPTPVDVAVNSETKEPELAPIDIPAFLPPVDDTPTGISLLEVKGEFIFEDVHVEDEEIVLDPTAVEVVSELSGTERPINEKLSLELLGETKFKGGDRTTVSIMVCRGTARKVVTTAQIMIKVLGSTFRPVIFHAKTDANGLANVHLQLPHFRAGRAALLIRAMADGEEIELRRVVTPG